MLNLTGTFSLVLGPISRGSLPPKRLYQIEICIGQSHQNLLASRINYITYGRFSHTCIPHRILLLGLSAEASA